VRLQTYDVRGGRIVSERSQTIRAAVEYDGTDFGGFQYQPQMRTVAGDLEAALSGLLGDPIKIISAGRTDAGVHASGQVISFSTPREFPFERLALALNAKLARDVSVREVAVVNDDFSARFSALERTYAYLVLNRPMRSAVFDRFAYHWYGNADLPAMREAAGALIGEHDFRSLCGMLPESGPTLRTVRSIVISRSDPLVCIVIRADGFLHRMVRNMVGTLLEVGDGRRSPSSIGPMLEARAREAAGPTAPPQGLFLAGVRYPDWNSFQAPLALEDRCFLE